MNLSRSFHILGVLFLWARGALGAAEPSMAAEPKSFTNPVVSGFHPDPSICRVGDDYFMVHSTFEYFPGVPIFQSRDLVNWKQIGHVLTRKSQLNLDKVRSSDGIYAPTIRYHDGTFYMITTVVGGGGNFYVTATNAAGPWSEPVWVDKGEFDPSLFFDGGKVYYTRQVDGERGYVGQQELDLKTGKLAGKLKELWRGTGGIWPEGPHMYKIGGKYYLMISEGGTSYDHRLTIARSDSPWGPFEPNPNNPILTHRLLPENPLQAMGHGDLIETPDGWWVVFLGIRPQGGRMHHLGRETFLAPVTWNAAGWPVVNNGEPITTTMKAPKLKPHPWPQESQRDEFDKTTLRFDWNFVRNPYPQDWSLTERPGWLRLHGSAVKLTDVDSPAFVARRQEDLNCRVAAKIAFSPTRDNEEAGLALRANDRNHYDLGITLRNGKRQVFLRTVMNGHAGDPVASAVLPDGEVVLSVRAKPLTYEFFYQVGDGKETSLGTARTGDLSSEVTSGQGAGYNFTGAYIGMYATGNEARSSAPADFDWFEYQPAKP